MERLRHGYNVDRPVGLSAETPLLWLTITLVIYYLADQLQQRVPWIPLFNPVLLSIVSLVVLLWATDTPYPTYFDGAQFVHFLLGPATVALALPLYMYQPRYGACSCR